MATHSSVLAWRIPGTGEPGGLPSVGSHRVGHDWSDSAAADQKCQECLFLLFSPSLLISHRYMCGHQALVTPSIEENDWTWDTRQPYLLSQGSPVHPEGNKPWVFIGRTDAEAPIFWPPDAKNGLFRRDPDGGKDWRQEGKGTTEDEMVT